MKKLEIIVECGQCLGEGRGFWKTVHLPAKITIGSMDAGSGEYKRVYCEGKCFFCNGTGRVTKTMDVHDYKEVGGESRKNK